MAAANQAASRLKRQALQKKIPPALLRWALRAMGSRVRDYGDAALFNFLTLVIAKVNEAPETDLLQLLDDTPWVIPSSSRRVSAFPRDFDILAFAGAYQKTLGAVRDARAKLPRGTRVGKRQLAHREILPGASPEALERYTLMEPQEVALEYVCWKFEAGRSGMALKKQLQRQLSPKRVQQLRDAARTEADAIEALIPYFPVGVSTQSVPSTVPPSSEPPASSTT